MEKRLKEVLNREEGNYILPFFWQHGEDGGRLREMMGAVYSSGIRAVCVESRPHPDFAGPGWWRDMDIIMDEARKRNMRVWVLDDAHFPSGYCNGLVEEQSVYAKRYLDHYTIDASGPGSGTSFFLSIDEGEELIGVVAARRKGRTAGEVQEPVDITHKVRGKVLYWDIPEGYWNIIVIKSTFSGSGRKKYINTIDASSVRFFLDVVYESHLEHYGEDFGNTFAGFFSDEPELGNCLGEYGHNAAIGQPDMKLPWGEELFGMVKSFWGSGFAVRLAALWNQMGNLTPQSRYEYMNMVTDLYGGNFCGQIGEWCREHGVEYIGHVIEDNGTHARLGLGTGHYFKALWGQHMSGIDVVLQQIRPGYDKMDFYHIGGKGTYNGTFFHHGLAKMGASLGHLDPKKKGRTMCEVYGAYGWSEGLKLMKWLTDHMLVRGVNWFVPHAFTAAPFPDPDCPPHFYGWGNNPQFPWFSCLCHYMNRMSHLLNGGTHIAEIALLYTAETEWMGSCQPFEEIGMLLAENQIDYEVVPIGILETCEAADGKMRAGNEEFSVLIVPDCEWIPEELEQWIVYAVRNGLPVLFAGRRPGVMKSGWRQAESFSGWKEMHKDVQGMDTAAEQPEEENGNLNYGYGDNTENLICIEGDGEKLLENLERFVDRDIRCDRKVPGLRYYHYRQDGGEFYMFFNEDPVMQVHSWVSVRGSGECQACWYNAFDNVLEPAVRNEKGEVELKLAPGQAAMLYLGTDTDLPQLQVYKIGKSLVLEEDWRISFRRYDEKDFGSSKKAGKLYNITAAEETEDFSGTLRYETDLEWNPDTDGELLEIDFGTVYETLEVWLNDEKASVRIAPPYCCTLQNLRKGTNSLTVYVANTLVHKYRDSFSATMPIEGSGLLGPVTVQGYWK